MRVLIIVEYDKKFDTPKFNVHWETIAYGLSPQRLTVTYPERSNLPLNPALLRV
jgi:hypothetical protein